MPEVPGVHVLRMDNESILPCALTVYYVSLKVLDQMPRKLSYQAVLVGLE